jgi:hypothetical protein
MNTAADRRRQATNAQARLRREWKNQETRRRQQAAAARLAAEGRPVLDMVRPEVAAMQDRRVQGAERRARRAQAAAAAR